jgi:hypothetical protein
VHRETPRRPQPPGVTNKIGEVVMGDGGQSDEDPRVASVVFGNVKSARVCLQTQGPVGFVDPDND